jgi:tetratricopeptide (TPR) repeat protein
VKSYSLFFVLLLATGMFAQQPSTPAPQASAPAQEPAKRAPHPKTQAEANDYKAAIVLTGGAASEKAANDFAAKYPDSELREGLYERAMHEYQTENAPEKVVAMAQKVLELDSTNSVALVVTAGALSDSLKENDPDQQKVKEILTNANLALQTIDTSFVPPGQVTPQQLAMFKNMLKAGAHSALGVTNLKMGNYAGAETELKAAIDLTKAQPDPNTYYELALAQDRQKKFPEALASVNEGLKLAASDPEMTRLLTAERDKVNKDAKGDQSPIK